MKLLNNKTSVVTFLIPVLLLPLVSAKKGDAIKSKENDLLNDNTNANFLSNDTTKMTDISHIEVNFRKSLERGNKEITKRSEITETNEIKSDATEILINNSVIAGIESNRSNIKNYMNKETKTSLTTLAEKDGKYVTPIYDNRDIDSLTITTPVIDTLKLPLTLDERWKNFSTNNPSVKTEEKICESTTITIHNGPYPHAALYNNDMIDQVSITMKSYTNGKSPSSSKVDGWDAISSLASTKPNGFKPLAGLYYDGFLDRPPIKIPGFLPYN